MLFLSVRPRKMFTGDHIYALIIGEIGSFLEKYNTYVKEAFKKIPIQNRELLQIFLWLYSIFQQKSSKTTKYSNFSPRKEKQISKKITAQWALKKKFENNS